MRPPAGPWLRRLGKARAVTGACPGTGC